MRFRLTRAIALGAFVVSAQQSYAVVNDSLQVLAPTYNEGGNDIEVIGPRSTLKLSVTGAQTTANTMTGGQPITKAALYGLSASGAIVTPIFDVSPGIQGNPVYNNSLGTTFDIRLLSVSGISDFFTADNLDGFEPGTFDDVVAVQIRVTTADRDLNTNGVQTFFDDISFSEDGDKCFTVDQQSPQLLGAYHDGASIRFVFSEILNSGSSTNDANQTVLSAVQGTDFQTAATNVFALNTPTAGTPFTSSAFESGQTVLRASVLGNANCDPGRFIRCLADDAGVPFVGAVPLNSVHDIAGNLAFQQDPAGNPVTTGVLIETGFPPVLREWVNPGTGLYLDVANWSPSGTPGLNDTLHIDRSPSSPTVNTNGILTSSRRLWTGGQVTMNMSGPGVASNMSYTETTEPSLVVGYAQLFGTLNITNPAQLGSAFFNSEWTNVGGPGAGIAALNIGTDVVFRTGKLLVSGPAASMQVNGTAILGFDDGVGATPPDFETFVTQATIAVAGAEGFLDANAHVTIGPLGTLRTQDGALATLNQGLTVLPSGSLQVENFFIGGPGPGFGLGVLGDVTLAANTSVNGLVALEIADNARLTIDHYEGDGINLIVDGQVSLAGTLQLEFEPGFAPQAGESFFVLNSNFPFSGRFALHVLPAFPDDRVATIEYITPALGTQAVSLSIQTLPSIIGVDENGDSTPVQGQPITAAAGDLNADGFDDLAVVVPDQNPTQPGSVFIFINNADVSNPGFSSTLQLTVGPDPTDVAIGDFDAAMPPIGQSDLDLAVTCAGDNSLRIYQNNGSASAFPQVANIPVPAGPADVDTADFNADTRDDLVVTCRDADLVRILINDSTLAATAVGFVPRDDIAAGDEPVDTDPVDLDNDKDIDVITGNFGSGTVGFATNDSDGDFGATGFAAAGNGPAAIDSGDIDGDLDADVIVANEIDGTVTVFSNTAGNLTPIGSIPVGAGASSVVLIDLDNDSDNDIAVIATPDGSDQRQIRILRNDTVNGGPPTFAAASSIGAGNGPVFILTGDVNDDTRPDLISIDSESADNPALVAAMPAGSESTDTLGAPQDGSVTVYLNFTTPAPACAGDTNLDGRVDGKDLSAILAKFGQNFPPLTGPNLNGDFVVNSADLSVALSSYGNVCRE